jgi:hypothetical protein
MVINTYYSYLFLHCTGCNNITSFFEMRAIQTVMEREWSHSEAVVLKICSLSLSAAIMRCQEGALFEKSGNAA